MICPILNMTMPMKATQRGIIAIFRASDRRPFQSLEAERISEALNNIIRDITASTLNSDTPTVASMPTVEVVLMAEVVLMVDVVLIAEVAATVLTIDDSIIPSWAFYNPNHSFGPRSHI